MVAKFGATSSTLTITNVVSTDAASYTVVVSGTAPCSAVTSNISALLVNKYRPLVLNQQQHKPFVQEHQQVLMYLPQEQVYRINGEKELLI
jgi:hypothetical protein